jgi:K(+)-stimulated pyrophosphate-energized sodium pump
VDPGLWVGLAVVLGLLGVGFSAWLTRDVLGRDQGPPEMREVAGAIFEAAMAFLTRQYRTIGLLAIVGAIVMGAIIAIFSPPGEQLLRGGQTAIAFIVGAVCSGISGFVGMFIAVRSNLRAAAAARTSLGQALVTALRGGAVSGFLVVALSLLGVIGIFYAFGGASDPQHTPFYIVGFGFGASFVALFAQLGGGIYTKAADVGADIVGKVVAGIPEDDPRNPAVVADLVGDNVGDCAGRGADLFESTAAENIGAMILGASIYAATGNINWILFPLVLRALGLVACTVGILFVQPRDDLDPMAQLNRGYYAMAALCVVFLVGATMLMLNNIWFALAGIVGIVTSIAFVYITQYYTSGTYRPVREIAEAAKTGSATTIISGIAVGFETTALPAVVISIALLLAYWFGELSGVTLNIAGTTIGGGLYGTAIATMGMLMSAAYILAMDTFGPITDNAGGIVEMSEQPEEVRNRTDALDAAGNTTKALTKGYAVGSAALAAFLLFAAYLDVLIERKVLTGYIVNLAEPKVFIGGFLGAMLIFLFSSLAIRAVGRAAGDMIQEVKRQWAERPGIMNRTERPDYARCVSISVGAALREMIAPGLLAVLVPILIGVLLGPIAAASLLMVGTMVGVLVACVLNNGGGAWDNAKKYIEAGHLTDDSGKVLGKGTEAHAASVVGDTVGDPFKDTAGPSLHVLIKLLSTITLVLAPLFIIFGGR